jgi:hypothetical protein
MPHPDIAALASRLLMDGFYDNEPDAVRGAIHLVAAAEQMARADALAPSPSPHGAAAHRA